MLTDAQRTALAARLRRGRENTTSQIQRRPADLADLPLSYAQEQLWFIDRLAPGRPTYNIPHTLALSGPLDQRALGRAIDALVARHEALRTRLVTGADGQPRQVIDPPAATRLELAADLSALNAEQRDARLRELIAERAIRPFKLAQECLLRTWLLRLADEEHVLLIVVHHTIFDGWSAGVLIRDLAALYGQEAGGEPAGLDELPVQFADYAIWERERLDGAAAERLADYWRQRLAGLEPLSFPTDRQRPVLDSIDGGLATRMTDPGLLAGVRELSRREGTTPLVTIMAAIFVLLARYTGQRDLVIGTVSAPRAKPELAPLIGFLVSTLPVRADLSGDPSFSGLLARVREATTGAYAHQDLPFAQIVQAAGVERDPGRTPVFQVALAYAEKDASVIRAADVGFTSTSLVVGVDAAKFDLDFFAETRIDGLRLECNYKTALFDGETAQRMLGHLEELLRGGIASPATPISELPVLTTAELRRELIEWNDTAAPVPQLCAHEEFEAQVERTPDAVAAQYQDELVSYAELNRQANQVARLLRQEGVGPEVLVGVCMPAGIGRVVALYGIWKAGGGYLPLDPALPAERLSYMVADAAVPLVLTDHPAPTAALDGSAVRVLSLAGDRERIDALEDHNLAGAGATTSNAAYVIYTSGSTGQPKGVVVEHRQALSFLHGMIGLWDVGPDDSVLAFSSIGFDASVQELTMPLLAGGRVLLAPSHVLHSPRRLAALMRDRRATFVIMTPAVLSLLNDEEFPDLRVLMCGGEAIPSELVGRWTRPGLRFVNDYGPTETAVTATVMELDAATPLPPPIGRPYPGYRVYVLDAGLRPVPVGVTGELHIGGSGVSRGYLRRPALTAERFVPDPFTPGSRLYKSGDLVRRRPDGTIVFLGRVDKQVKIRGLRIELGEIETALATHPAVAQAVVTVVAGPQGDCDLAGYLRAEPGAQPDHAELRAYLARTLPGYMVPAHLINVESFPLNSSGKVDHAALPAPPAAVTAVGHEAPGTATETVIARLFGTVLDREPVGATANFFQVGGSSLRAMRLVDLIAAELGTEIDPAAIFLSPTPRQLAAGIDAAAAASGTAAGPLTELASGAGEPLILFHAVGGTVFAYAQLAQELAGTFRVYGLAAPGLTEPGATASSLDGLVADYTRLITQAQPAGPYRLAGWSMGGLIAFEVARRLERAGADVRLLTLLDAPFALPGLGEQAEQDVAGQFVADVTASLGMDPSRRPDPASTPVASQLSWLADELGAATQLARPADQRLGSRYDVFRAHVQMLDGYQPDGPAIRARTLIISASRSLNAPAAARWRELLGSQAQIQIVDSDHYGFLGSPAVTQVATWIRQQNGAGDGRPERGPVARVPARVGDQR